MDEQTIKRLILDILQEKMAADVLVLYKGGSQALALEKIFTQTCRELGLTIESRQVEENFLRPKRALYLRGFDLKDTMDILIAPEGVYETIRVIAKTTPVFLEVAGLDSLEEEGRGDFLQGLTHMVKAKGIQLLSSKNLSVKSKQDHEDQVEDLRGKKILTLGDIRRHTVKCLLVDQDARCTMALSDWLREKKIEIRRMKCN